VQQIWCHIRSQNLASYSILNNDGKFQSPPRPPPQYFHATPSTLKLAGVHHLGPVTNSQLFHKSLILLCVIQTLIAHVSALQYLLGDYSAVWTPVKSSPYQINTCRMFDKHLTHTVRCLFSVNGVSVVIYISFPSLHLDTSISEIIGVLQYLSCYHE